MQKTLVIVLVVAVIALSGVIVYQKLTPTETTPIVVNQPAVNQPVVNQPSANTNCLKEGEGRADDAGSNVPDKCCAGLVKVEFIDEFSPGAICKTTDQLTSYDPFRCTACGNGVCGTGENKCNCPVDCK